MRVETCVHVHVRARGGLCAGVAGRALGVVSFVNHAKLSIRLRLSRLGVVVELFATARQAALSRKVSSA